MKNIILCVLAIACIALGVLAAKQISLSKRQSSELALATQRVAALEAELKEKSEAIENAKSSEAKAKILQKTLAESTTTAVEQSKKAEQLEQSLADAKTNNPMHSLAAMFKDPKMREMMKSQQKALMGPIVDKQYSDLVKQLNLTPDQAANFKDLIQKKMLAGADVGFSMLDDSLDASQRADLAKQVKSQTDDMDNQIKDFLGDSNYQAYESYEKTIPDRTTVSQFSDQFTGTANALSAGQQEQLTQALSDARNNFKWSTDLGQNNPDASPDFSARLSEDSINKFVQDQEQFDQEFLPQAQKILTPEQYKQYEDFITSQRNLQVAGLKMAAAMFKH